MRVLCFFFITSLFSVTEGNELAEPSTDLKIVMLRPSVPWTVHGMDEGRLKLNTTNNSVVIAHSEVPNGGPFVVLQSMKHQLSSEDVFIVEGGVCERADTFLQLLNITSTCHRRFSALLPGPAGQQPNNCDVFGNAGVDTIVNMLPDLLKILKWGLVFIFHDQGMEELIMHLSDKLSRSGIKVVTNVIHQHLTENHFHDQLYSYYQTTDTYDRNFLLLCQGGCVNRLMKLVNEFDRKNSNMTALQMLSKWLVYGERMDPGLSVNLTVDNVAVITVPEITYGGNASDTETELADHLESVYSRCIDGITTNNGNNEAVGRQMIKILEDGTGCWRGRVDTLLYKTSGRVFSRVGQFDLHGRISQKSSVFPNAKFGFNGRKLIIGTQPMFPFVMESNSTLSGYKGLCLDLLAQISASLNFTYDIVRPADNEWGRVVNGSWTGLVLGLQNKEMDLVTAPLTVSTQRETVMDFSVPFYYDYGVGIYKLPDPSRSKWMKLIKPFKGMVLACLGISLVASAFLLCIMETASISLRNHQKTPAKHVFQESIWYLYGAMLAHGGSQQPRSESGRVLVGFWWLFCIVIAASYSGKLIAFLTVNKENPPFETLADLGDQTDYTWGTVGGSSWITYFEDTSIDEIRKLWNGMEKFSAEDPGILSLHEVDSLKKVRGGSFVFFSDSQRLKLWTSQDCTLALMKETFYPFTYALGLQKNSPYSELISETMLAIDQSGLFQTWKRKWWPRENMCLDDGVASYEKKIALDDLQSAFFLICIGIVLASIALAVEKFVSLTYFRSDDSKPNVSINGNMNGTV